MKRRMMTTALCAASLGMSSAREPSPPVKMVRAWPVMGTMFVATVWGTDTAVMLGAIHAARDSVRLVDSLLSNYRPESELSQLNAAAGTVPMRVSPQTMHVLLHARDLWRISGGQFDPTIGPLVGAWGFYGDSGRVPTDAQLDSLRRLVGFGRVQIDGVGRTVRLPAAGMRLDLGGIAKGYALDLARAALKASTIRGATLDLGGNILVFGRPPAGDKWVIGIQNPRRDGSVIGTVTLDSGAVATSGDYEHFYIIDGVRYGHLIDPATGYPKRGVVAATAIGPRGEWSDGVSAMLFLAGPERGSQIADSLADVGGVWIMASRRTDSLHADLRTSRRARMLFTKIAAPDPRHMAYLTRVFDSHRRRAYARQGVLSLPPERE